jgi:ATP-binding cassette subfamily B protein
MVAKRAIEVCDIQAFYSVYEKLHPPHRSNRKYCQCDPDTIASAERVFEVLEEKEQTPDADEVSVSREAVRGEVRFENVSFRYKEDVPLIENMNIHIKPGQTAAIVGPTGAGKTTLVNLLLRFYELNGGRITIDGADIAGMPRGDLRSLFGMVLQYLAVQGDGCRKYRYGLAGAEPEDHRSSKIRS